MKPRGFFVTGTDTAVGKTRFSVLLLRAYRAAGFSAVGFKPICCGDRDDAVQLLAASRAGFTIDQVNPVWFRTPAAPIAAALAENRAIELGAIAAAYAHLRQQVEVVIVEGAGGWLVPITAEFSMADLAGSFALPVIVVVRNRLGCLNHTLLTVANIEARGLECRGFVLNQIDPLRDAATESNRRVLERCLPGQLLGELHPDAPQLPAELCRRLLGDMLAE